ncbi:unnamed protein product [Aphis gossypii]|uniref:Uncharacterized protein n=1 Tax=Aphis gossypii TaxID=80765 RepID=A0A9P0NIU4_APHGO|nr:unnamed protein product [Aphis gossypii]
MQIISYMRVGIRLCCILHDWMCRIIEAMRSRTVYRNKIKTRKLEELKSSRKTCTAGCGAYYFDPKFKPYTNSAVSKINQPRKKNLFSNNRLGSRDCL